MPRYVERELRTYLACGIHTHGFLRARCSGYIDKMASSTGLPIYIGEYDINLADDAK